MRKARIKIEIRLQMRIREHFPRFSTSSSQSDYTGRFPDEPQEGEILSQQIVDGTEHAETFRMGITFNMNNVMGIEYHELPSNWNHIPVLES